VTSPCAQLTARRAQSRLIEAPRGLFAAAAPDLPTMVVYGDHDDPWPPAHQHDLAHRLRAREVVLPGAGHAPAIDDPALIAETLASFWRTA
jgi:pimeloyl-ACP methyl ester carboxylesterase